MGKHTDGMIEAAALGDDPRETVLLVSPPQRVREELRRRGKPVTMVRIAALEPSPYMPKAVAVANAQRLALAWNAHDELVSCLTAYVEIEEEAAPASSSPLRERARAALRLAEPTP